MSQPLSANVQISHYRIVSKLGAGGMGEVWLAEDTRLGRKVALKLLPAEFTEDSDRVRRFTQEAKAASALNHPNIISVHDIGESESGRFIVMEFVSGKTLRQVIAKENSVENLFTLGPQMARALSTAHAAGITHRDIKPDNIMVRDDGYVKMLDFGLARLLPTTSSDPEGETLAQQTTPGTVIGTLAYMSPEQASGQFATAPSDVFSLGVVLYELATGHHPFKSETMIGYLHAITSQTPASMTSVKPGLSTALDELILRMLEKEADDRPTASEVAQALTDIERHGTTSALHPRTLIKTPQVTKSVQGEEGFWVAVLPFKYRGGNADLESLAEGLSEDIITGLSRFSSLRVIARGSTLRFTSETADVRAIGKELGARYVMDGSLRQAGSVVRLIVQLIDASTGAHLWAETFDRQVRPEDLFALQDELVPRIVSTVADWYGVLTHSMSEAVRQKPLDQLTPYEALLRSFGYYERVTAEEQAAARSAMERAVEQAPGNADSWAMLSMIYGEEHRFDFNVLPDSLGRSLQAARRAVSIAPSNHFAHLAHAQALFFRKEFEAFRIAAERAIALNPMDGSTVQYLAHLICFSGDWDYGSQLAEQTRQLNPNHPGWYWAVPFFNAYRNGDYVGARAFVMKGEMANHLWNVMLGAVYGQLGEFELAEKSVTELLSLVPDFAQTARRTLEKWYPPDLVEGLIDGLRKAGLEMEGVSADAGRQYTSSESRSDKGFWVAVLPFKYRGGNTDLEALAEGLSEDIITGLSRFSILRVIARGSTLRFTSESVDLRSIGRQLGARYVMEGSLRQVGSMLRLVVQLVDATTGAHLWAETYDRPTDSEKIFALHDDLVPRIVSTVADWYGALTHSMSEAVFLKPIDQLTPYEAVLRGYGYYERVTPEEHDIVRSRLEEAVGVSPGNADAWAMLSMMYGEEYRFGFNEQPDSMKRSLQAARRAVDLAPANHFAYLALAQALYFSKEHDAFRNAAARAIALNPMDGSTLEYLGHLFAFSGDWEYGCELAERARDLNPNHPVWYWALPFLDAYRSGNYVDARPYAIKFFIPGFYLSQVMLGAVYGQLGERDAAAKAVQDLLALIPDSAVLKNRLDRWYQPELVEKLMDGLRKAGLDSDEGVGTSQTAHFISSETRSDEGFWVAVLPFKFAPELETLAEGLSEEIVTGLSRFSYLRVISRSSTLRYAGKPSDVRNVGKELGARYVIEGSLRLAGSLLRASVQLADATTGEQLWAEAYDRPFRPEDFFTLQDDLVPRIVSTVADQHGVLPHSMSESIRRRDPEQLTPYEAVVRCFRYYEGVTETEHAVLRTTLERAVKQAPSNADCWAMLAIMYCDEHKFGFNELPGSLDRALTAARTATEISLTNPLACEALSQALFFRKEFASFRNAAERAISLNPVDGATTAFMGMLIAFTGDWEHGCAIAERATQLNPHHPGWYSLATFYNAYRKHDYDEALKATLKFNMPSLFYNHSNLAAVYAQLGDIEAASKSLRDLLTLKPDFGSTARDELSKWLQPEFVEHLIDGFRKAGLTIGDADSSMTMSGLSAVSSEIRADEGFWVAVLPFRATGSDPELAILAEGLSDEIITGLNRFSYLRVIARSSTLRYASQTSDVRTVGKSLGARYLMEGNLRQAGSKVRVAVQLVDTTTGADLWAENYERNFSPESLFELQDDLVPRIVSTIADLHGVLPRSLSEIVRSRRLEELSPYESVLRSFAYFDRVTAEALTDARSCVESAVEKAPGNADAWSMLSILCAQDYGQGFELQGNALSTSLTAARRAVELAPSNHLAWFSLAQAEFFHKEFQNLQNAVTRVVGLNPMDGNSLAFLGEMLIHVGDWERGLELAHRAKELNPHHPGWYWYADFFNAYRQRDYHGALSFARKANLPNHWGMHVAIAASAGQLGEIGVAAKALRELHELRPEFGSTVREEMKKWWEFEVVEHLIEGLRKAGLQISDSEPPSSSVSLPQQLFANQPKVVSTNLPKDRTRFIGRTRDLAQGSRLLEDTRLLTLTGLGGCGKTRLAIKLAENVSQQFPNGVWFVDLTPLAENSKIDSAVAQVLGLKEEAGKSLDEQIRQYVADKKILLVLDNCEHLVSACADFVDKLFSSCSGVQILATSREPLSVQGERVVALHPLEVPAPKTETDLEALQNSDAVKLFIDRAQQVQGEFALTKSNASSIAEICRKLDGIPLAIELAAARVKILTTEQILSKLDDRFKLLSTTGRGVPTRHQTLRAVIEWSYDHLSDEERLVIRALSVFAGGWTLPLAASVARGFDEFEMLDLHSQLVDKSIAIVEAERAAIRRYGFLETVRQFLAEQLNQNSEDKLVRAAHFSAILSLAEQAYTERIAKEEYWSEQLEVERDNLRVALEYARATDAENYLQLVGALGWFWVARTHLFEGYEHLKAAVDSSSLEPPRPARARVLWGAAQILAIRGNATEAHTLMDEALRTWRELGDTHELALALEAVGWSHFFSGEDEEALKVFEECLRLQQATGDRHLIIRAMVGLAQILVALGRTDEAIPMSREIIEFSKEHNDKRSEHFGWHYLADCELILGNCQESLELYKQSLELAHALGDKVEIGCEIQGVAMSLAGLGQKERAVRFAAAVRGEWDRIGVDIQVPFWDALQDRYIGSAKRGLEPEDYEREWSKGRSMSFDDAVTLALDV